MSYEFYKVLHISGILLVFVGLCTGFGSLLINQTLTGVSKKIAFISHGIGLTLVLVSGFGLAARLDFISALPTWIYFKIGIWVYFGLTLSVLKRKPKKGPIIVLISWILATVAAFLAIHKP